MKTWQKILVILGVSLVLAGSLVFIYGYLTNYVPYESFGENGAYDYVDYVGMFGSLFAYAGFAVLVLTVMLSLRAKQYRGRYH